MGRQEEAGLFLACQHDRYEETLPNGVKVRGFKYNMEEYLRSIVQKYGKLMIQHHGEAPRMLKVPNPFLPEDHKDAPARHPVTDYPATVCPFCDASFPISKF